MERDDVRYAFVITTDGEIYKTAPKNGKDFQLNELRAAVGGNIEIVRPNHMELMVVNEEGHLLGLELNVIASRYAGQPIVGNVLVCPCGWIK